MPTFGKILDYILDTKIGYGIIFVITALILYAIFKLIIKVVDYIVFKKLMKEIIKSIYEDDNDWDEFNNNPPSSYHEDEQSQKKDKKREDMVEAERLQNMENEIRGGHKNITIKKRIVAIDPNAIKGYWTKRVFYKDILPKYKNIDFEILNSKGYFQAKEMARMQQRQVEGMKDGSRYR